MFFFISCTKPFGENALNISNIISEFGFSCIFPIIAIFLFEISQDFQNTLDYVLIVLTNIIVLPQIAASLYIFIRTIRQKILARSRAKIKAEQNPEIRFEGKTLILPEIIEEGKIEYISAFSPMSSVNMFPEKMVVSPVESISPEIINISSLRVIEELRVGS